MAPAITGVIGGGDVTTEEDRIFGLGDSATGKDGTKWMYVTASAAIAQYDVVGVDENFAAAPLTKAMADDGWFIGFAQDAFASGASGFVACNGSNIQANVLANCAADAALYTTATAGSLDDESTNQTKISGVTAVTAVGGSAGNVEVIANNPHVVL